MPEMTISRPPTARTNRTLECLRKVIDFAKSLQKCLIAAEIKITASKRAVNGNESVDSTSPDEANDGIDSINGSSLDDAIAAISSLPSSISSAKHGQGKLPLTEDARIESFATKLWNQCTRVSRMIEDMNSKDQSVVLEKICRGRLFAFLLLEYATVSNGKDPLKDDVRLLKVAFRTASTFVEKGHLDLGLRVIEKAAPREDRISSLCGNNDPSCDISQDEERILRRLSSEYHILRMSLSWRQNRLDITEHMFSKVSTTCIEQESSIAEALADLCYEIATTQLEEKDFPLAVRWLERAADALAKHELEELSAEADELRLAVWHSLVRAKLATPNADEAESSKVAETLSKEYGNRLPVMLLNLEIIGRESEPDLELYHEKLIGLIRTIPLSEANLNLILRHIYWLKETRLDLAKDALYQLIFQRLGLQNNSVLIGKGFVTYVWMQTSDSTSENLAEQLHPAATKLHSMTREPLYAEATYACLILIWKEIDQCFGLRDFATAERWLQLARHPIFQNSGETNKSKISRKLMSCHLERGDATAARLVFEEASDCCKAEILTIYLLHSVALLDDDLNLATSCIEKLCQQGPEGRTYVQACVAESQRTGKKHHAALALQRLLNDMLESRTADGTQLPLLLRCTARLLISESESCEPQRQDIENEICNIFDAAMVQAENYSRTTAEVNPFTLTELEWFSKNSYNLAVQHCSVWAPRNIQRLLTVSMKLTEIYPSFSNDGIVRETQKRRMLCNFLCAIICMAQARVHPDPQRREEHYATSRKHILGFRQYLLECESMDEESLEKHRTLLAFDFEAALRLRQFTDLSEIVDEAQQYADEELYAIFIDAILGSDAPVGIVAEVFQQIILYVIRDNQTDTTKISRWLRCLFQLALDSNVSVAESVLEQAYAVARDAHHQQLRENIADVCYPSEEVEWLATTGFNKAVDLYLSGDDEACRRWASKALDMADLLHDKGMLFQLLKGKMSALELE